MVDSLSPVLVTGGAGFIGSSFVRHLLGQNQAIVVLDALTYAGCLDNLTEVAGAPGYRFVQGDIADGALVADLLATVRPRAIVNIAAETHVDRSIDGPAAFVHSNLVGTAALLEAARGYWRDLREPARAGFRYVQVSTDEVYGSVVEGASREGDPYFPNSPYSASKAGGDHMVRAYHHTYGLPTLVTNGSNTYGPRQFPEKLIPLHILNACDGRPLPVFGDGRNQREWLHVEDHCRGIAAVLEKGRPGESYNVGSGIQRANLDVVRELCATLDDLAPRRDGRAHAEAITHVTDRPGHDFRYSLDCAKLTAETGWRPQVALVDGLRATVRWYLEHGDWCRAITEARYDRNRLGTSL
ncbi:MAG: dTDP-glucose 4,6-dehydratase [Magnetococcales bacterium]|nr:dTDP-glucose 4,6-dehydratase [Magnetococcales bacterium]